MENLIKFAFIKSNKQKNNMKKIYTFLILVSFSSANLIAQVAINSPRMFPAPKGMKNSMQNTSSRDTDTYYLDYESYDSELFGGDYETFVTDGNFNDTTSGSFRSFITTYDTLVLTKDNVNFISKAYDGTVLVDSVFATFHHQNNSGQNDTILFQIIELGAAPAYRPTTTVLWSDSIITNTSLTGIPTTPGSYPNATFWKAPNFTIPSGKRFGVQIEFHGHAADTFMLRFGFGTDPNLGACGAAQFARIVPSEFYPVSYYRIGGEPGDFGFNSVFPTSAATNNLYWYNDCNGNNQVDGAAENTYQNWSVWASITYTDYIGINETSVTGLKLLQNIPNPASKSTSIAYETASNGNVSLNIFNIAGKEVLYINEGNKAAGKYNIKLNTSSLSSGVYYYTLNAGDNKITKKMVIIE